jgi:hypothetical protein
MPKTKKPSILIADVFGDNLHNNAIKINKI